MKVDHPTPRAPAVTSAELLERLRAERVVAVLRRVEDLDGAIERVRAAGVSLIEITLDSLGALEAIARHPGSLAGTVLRPGEVEAAHAAGAIAVVSPAFVPDVAERARALGIAHIPGALTPSEVVQAMRAGVAAVKLFPAALGGPDYVRQLLGPLDVPLLATGGVNAANARSFLDAGAIAVGVGTSLLRDGEAERAMAACR